MNAKLVSIERRRLAERNASEIQTLNVVHVTPVSLSPECKVYEHRASLASSLRLSESGIRGVSLP